MKRTSCILIVAFALSVVPVLHAEVKKEERNQIAFAGMLGKVVNLFGGRAAKEGVVSTVAVSGDRKLTTSGDTGKIVDLREEKVYELDMRRKTYKVTTFEELRRQMREAEAKAREEAAKQAKETKQEPPPEKPSTELEVEFDIKNTGQTKAVNGFDTRQVVATIAVHEKGKTIEQSGGILMTVDTWLTRTVSLKEIADFDRRFFEKIAGPVVIAEAQQQMATALVMYPGMKEAFARLSRENFDGTAIITTTTVDAVKTAEQMKEQEASSAQNDSPNPLSVGGAIGGFMRRRAQQKEQAAGPASPRANIMTMNAEVLKIATNVTAADVAMPEGFKERN